MPIKTQRDELPALNLTPMIDVVFLLIVFFMAATEFADAERDLALQLPQVEDAPSATPRPAPRVVTVAADGATRLDGAVVELAQLRALLAEARQTQPRIGVVIRGDQACAYQFVAAAMAACQQAGVADLSVSVQVANQPRTAR
jgi:biopolymer transport protein ExbD